MTKREAIENIMNRIAEIEDEAIGYVGIRVQENPFTEDEELNNSYVWVDGESTDEELDGTCAVSLNDAELALGYFGDHVAIIEGEAMEWGEDLGEVILRNAVVKEVIC